MSGPCTQRCLLVGTAGAILQVTRQLALLDDAARPTVFGALLWREVDDAARQAIESQGVTILGLAHELERFVVPGEIDSVIISLPAAMSEAVAALRTSVRRLGVADRFFPTIEDQLAGVGPRSQFEINVADLIGRTPHRIDERAIGEVITGRVVLITGAGGSIGSELARRCAAFNPAQLVLMERSENALFEIDRQIARLAPNLSRRALLHDVTDASRTLALCREIAPQVIFHSAAHKHVPMMQDHPIEAIRNNFFGTVSIADAAADCGCERFVMISTDKAVNPTSIMGATKRLAELYVQHMNQQHCGTIFRMVRFGNVLASSGSVLPTWAEQIRQGGPVTVTHPEMTRYFMTIPEAASLVIQAAALEDRKGGEVLLLDMGEPISILELARRYVRAHGLEPRVEDASPGPGPSPQTPGHICIVFTGIRPGEKLFEELACDGESMLPTSHPGIHIWTMAPPAAEYVADLVCMLEGCCAGGDAAGAEATIRSLLPEMVQQPVIPATVRRRKAEAAAA
ncbi:MAG: polysaccharide biosynthesis protein [Phycisphaerales bacterium]|nr:polysaccharide biosynthesis protein [Phycisphaerales bacterium]